MILVIVPEMPRSAWQQIRSERLPEGFGSAHHIIRPWLQQGTPSPTAAQHWALTCSSGACAHFRLYNKISHLTRRMCGDLGGSAHLEHCGWALAPKVYLLPARVFGRQGPQVQKSKRLQRPQTQVQITAPAMRGGLTNSACTALVLTGKTGQNKPRLVNCSLL